MKLITTLLKPIFTNAKFYTNFAYTILVPVRVLLVTWCVLINESCKHSNFCVLGTFPDFQLLTWGLICCLCNIILLSAATVMIQ